MRREDMPTPLGDAACVYKKKRGGVENIGPSVVYIWSQLFGRIFVFYSVGLKSVI